MPLLEESREAFRNVKGQYCDRGLVLFVGAGISMGSGLPTWCELTRRVLAAIPNGAQVQETLQRRGYSELAKLGLAKSVLGDEQFFPILREALYRDAWMPSAATHEEMRAEMNRRNPTLAALGELLCVFDGSQWKPNPDIKAILTTNVDTLLTSYVRQAFRPNKGLVRSVERASAGPRGTRIPIYYMHGMFNATPGLGLNHEAPDRAVFTEAEYFLAYRDSLSTFTYTPSFLFREHTVLFVGTSLEDPNIRRLLCWSQEEIRQGYRSEGKEFPKRKQIRHYALLPTADSHEREIVTSLMRPLAVAPLWFQDFADVPVILRELAQCRPARA